MKCECGSELTENDLLDMCNECMDNFIEVLDRRYEVFNSCKKTCSRDKEIWCYACIEKSLSNMNK